MGQAEGYTSTFKVVASSCEIILAQLVAQKVSIECDVCKLYVLWHIMVVMIFAVMQCSDVMVPLPAALVVRYCLLLPC